MLKTFPEARVIHLHRDGRDVAMSMSRHGPFQGIVRYRRIVEALGVDMEALLTTDGAPAWTQARLALDAVAAGLRKSHEGEHPAGGVRPGCGT